MIRRAQNYLRRLRAEIRIGAALSRAAALAPLRRLDPTRPSTWEFSAFSQNGEDGITDYLMQQLVAPDRTFCEIGASDGVENMTAWLALARRYSGIMIDGDPASAGRAALVYPAQNLGVDYRQLFVTEANVAELAADSRARNADFFSLDIDGIDYFAADSLFRAGIRPKVMAVEYNSIYGPDRSVTVKYAPDFDLRRAHPSHLYYGVSIAGWRRFFAARGYRFVTVDLNGVNAYFARPECFAAGFVDALRGLAFAENFAHRTRSPAELAAAQAAVLQMPLTEIG